MLNECKERGARIRSIRVDDCGLGGGVTDRLEELGYDVIPMNFGTKAFDSERFADLRTETWWHMRELFAGGELSIPHEPELISELTAPTYKYLSNGKLKLESKED